MAGLTTERFEFGSLGWYDAVAAIVHELLSGADLDCDYSFSEEFVAAPAHLPRDARGRVGWHFVVSRGELTTGFGPLDEADTAITADYTFARPLAAIAHADVAKAQEVRRAVQTGMKTGKLMIVGTVATTERFPTLAALHDRVAAVTVESETS